MNEATTAVSSGRPRIVVGGLGDGHERVARVIGRRLRRAGIDVSYAGRAATPEQMVEAALAEGADAIGLSIATTADTRLVMRTIRLLHAKGGGTVRVVVAGAVGAADAEHMTRLGVHAVLATGASVENFATSIRCRAEQPAGGLEGRP